ncbi:MAG: tRNA lysidine(34) synthetase TilS [Lachnospiraceae bacterium]|nr:tRNA lysidine(34) synthetase TilS [Lachnospiraceae bacterium]
MDRVEEEVLSFIKSSIGLKKGDTVIVGVSGGSDSVALFRILYAIKDELGINLHVVHVEHGIRGEESIYDASFTSELVGEYDVDIDVCNVKVPKYAKENGMSEEEAARVLRYKAFRDVKNRLLKKNKNVYIAVAHHKEDSVETVLLQLIRGTGLKGLTGLRPVRDDVIRPLLNLEKSELIAYLDRLGQNYRIDKTNFDDEIQRNRIRHEILPILKDMNNKAMDHILHSASIVMEAERHIAEEGRFFSGKYCKDNIIDCEKICELDSVLRRQVILEALRNTETRGKDVSAKQIVAIEKLCFGEDKKSINLSGRLIATRKNGKIVISTENDVISTKNDNFDISLERFTIGEKKSFDVLGYHIEISLMRKEEADAFPESQYTKWFDYDKIVSNLHLRNRRTGDYFVIDSEDRTQLLRRFMINEKIPSEDRNSIVLLASDNRIHWAIGYRVGYDSRVTDETENILLISARRKENE